jgi:3-phytase
MRIPPALALTVLLASGAVLAQSVSTVWTQQTEPGPRSGTSTVQDVAVWVNPARAANSVLLTADNQNGLVTFAMDGGQVEQRLSSEGITTSVDVHDGFVLGNVAQPLVVSANPTLNGLVAYVVDPVSLKLRPVSTTLDQGFNFSTVRLYQSPTTGLFYAFAGTAGTSGVLRQLELTGSDGGVSATLVRSFNVSGGVAGAVADDSAAVLYVTQAGQGIFRFGAEPDGGTTGTQVTPVGVGTLSAQVGRLALYALASGEGYLLAADTGNSTFAVFDRRTNTSLGSFSVVQDGGTDSVDAPRGLAVVSGAVPPFSEGLFVAHDSNHLPADNLKLVSWGNVARAFSPPLRIGSQVATDAGTGGDAGVDGGGIIIDPGDGTGGIGTPPKDEGGCSCATTSVPAVTMFGVLALVLLGRRRRS